MPNYKRTKKHNNHCACNHCEIHGRGAYSLKDVARGVGRAAIGAGRLAGAAARGVYNLSKNAPPGGYFPGAGSYIGKAIGSRFGVPTVGQYLGNKIGQWSGLGAYKLRSNTIIQNPPRLSNTTSGVRIKHREYIQDVASSILFNNQLQLPINPGVYNSFPWLSGIASNYTQYKLHGLIYEYLPTSGNAVSSTNSALGEIMMATNYNVGDSQFTNKQAMLNEEFSTSIVPTEKGMHPIECSPNQSPITHFYVRNGAEPTANVQDLKFYDMGLFQLAVQGQQVGTGSGGATSFTMGELWCTYDIEFFKPQLDDFEGINALGSHYSATAGVTAAVPLGTSQKNLYDSIGLTFNGTTGTIITIPEGYIGQYALMMQYIGTATSTLVAPIVTYTNAVGIKLINAQTATTMLAPTGGTDNSTNIVQVVYFTVTNPTLPTTVIFGVAGTLPVSVTQLDLVLCQLPFSMT